MAKLFIIARKAAPSLCMSMKISPSEPSCVLAGAEVDLVAADDRLLGVALAPLGQALAVRPLDLPVDDLLDDLLGEHRDALGDCGASASTSSRSSSSSISEAESGWLSLEPSR